jgi:hypothetical protein
VAAAVRTFNLIDHLLLGDSYAGSCQGGDQPVPREARWTMEGWISAEHLVDAILDVMNADAVIVEDDPVRASGRQALDLAPARWGRSGHRSAPRRGIRACRFPYALPKP